MNGRPLKTGMFEGGRITNKHDVSDKLGWLRGSGAGIVRLFTHV